jgi:predicted ribosome quality control (RQC) complex YloA/Tae2 family protein
MTLQPCDVTTLRAVCQELRRDWVPARIERVVQTDKYHLYVGVRTLRQRGWLVLSWHPQASRLHASPAPPAVADTFTFSQQLWHQLGHLALTDLRLIDPWERVVVCDFASRPGDPPQWHLYLEVMGRYSNAILTHADGTILTCAHQVSPQESRVRPLQTGTPYQLPPALTQAIPRREEPFTTWQHKLTRLPLPLSQALIQNYRGLSRKLLREMGQQLHLDPDTPVMAITPQDWQRWWTLWQDWLAALAQGQFTPGLTTQGYTVLGWGITQAFPTVSDLLHAYYQPQLAAQALQQHVHYLTQKLHRQRHKLQHKAQALQEKLQEGKEAERYRQQADLLMAHLHQWSPGMRVLELPDFTTAEPIRIAIPPDQTALQTAQELYKKYQKLKRTQDTVLPLLEQVHAQIAYLEQVETFVHQLDLHPAANPELLLADIYSELAQQGYSWQPPTYRPPLRPKTIPFLTFTTPHGYPVYVGRNNRQNELLTFTYAKDDDLWFHAQEIPGSHVIMRLPPRTSPSPADLQTAADIAAYYSRSRHSQQVPVVYTPVRYVQRLKGHPPGTVTYRRVQVIWGRPAHAPVTTSTWEYPQPPHPQPQPQHKTPSG